MSSPRAYVGVDVGGTFTDLVMFDGSTGKFSSVKVPSSPPRFWPSVIRALEEAGIEPGRATMVLHGTTVHLNAFLERKGARLALVTTKGFRDVYEMRRGNRPQPYDMHFRYPEPLVQRASIFELEERTSASGDILVAPSDADLEALAAELTDGGYESVAVCLLHSYRNTENEATVAAALREALPGVLISPSHEVCREWREFERTSTVVINAYASPVLQRYLQELQKALSDKSETRLFLLQSNGGLIRAEDAGDKGVLSLLSGPIGGNVAGRALAAEAGQPDLICIDMGGTSFEASLVVEGESAVRTEREVGGFPILAPMVDIHTVGAGGGSIAWNDTGALRVGPHSAGATPGPASYGHGGTDATVTDANLALGRLQDGCAFGDLRLQKMLACEAVERIAGQFGLSVDAMAQGILDVINEQMANAIRTITVRRGIDPRRFALVAYGGAGPMHAADIARLLDIQTVVIPRAAGAFSAWGMLQSDLIEDRSETFLAPLAEVNWQELDRRFIEIERSLTAALQGEGVGKDEIELSRALDVRYVGQEQAISVPITPEIFKSDDPLSVLKARFEEAYSATFGHSNPEEVAEVAAIRTRAIGRTGLDAKTLLSAGTNQSDLSDAPRTATVVFDGQPVQTIFMHRSALSAGVSVDGPAVIEEETCTTVVPPDFTASLDSIGNLILQIEGGKK